MDKAERRSLDTQQRHGLFSSLLLLEPSTKHPNQCIPAVISPEIKQLEGRSEHSFSSNVEIKNA